MNEEMMLLTFLLGLGYLTTIIHAETEHKVHNIVLYPEKHSWCQITPIQQVVSSPGYKSITIQNNVCVGACFSYSIPKSVPAEPGELIGPYCDSCQPSEVQCYHVNLETDGQRTESPKVFQKLVQIIVNCSCQTCDKVHFDNCTTTDSKELPTNMFIDQENNAKNTDDDISPDLFNAQYKHKQRFEDYMKLKNKLKKWFENYQSGEDKAAEQFDIDMNNNNNAKNNEKINKDLEGLPKNFGVEGTATHQKGGHYLMGIAPHPNEVIDPDAKTNIEVKHHNNHHHHQHHQQQHPHHHLGEEQLIGMDVTHLVRGPHGSMVAEPQEIKIHINSDSLQPNDEGLVIEYENHHNKDPIKVANLAGSN